MKISIFCLQNASIFVSARFKLIEYNQTMTIMTKVINIQYIDNELLLYNSSNKYSIDYPYGNKPISDDKMLKEKSTDKN